MPIYLNPAPGGEWWDYSWNPVTGCENNCEYCYARKMAWRFGKTEDEKNFKPAFHPERLDAPSRLKTPSRIFVCSNADLFGDWVPEEWIIQVLYDCYKYPFHKFLFLTKNPWRYRDFKFPDNCALGITSTGFARYDNIKKMTGFGKILTFASFEPLLLDIYNLKDVFVYRLFNWIIVGAQTPYSAKTAPKPEWVREIIAFAREYNIPLFLKNNLRWPETIKEFPEGLILDHERAAGRPEGMKI